MSSPSTILVTGGAGYIGSHAALRLLADGHRVVIFDDLSRGNLGAIHAIASTLPPGQQDRFSFEQIDLLDRVALKAAFARHRVDAVMHFAALAYVGESVQRPLEYWRVNVGSTVNLLEAMEASGSMRLVFSSSCATFGEAIPPDAPISESAPQNPINPYGASKLICERIIREHAAAVQSRGSAFSAAMLRYFNVAGSDPALRIGEHHEPETHLIPIVLQCLAGLRPESDNTLTILGDDYATPDGTCVRDYIHVVDLVDAHVRVLAALKPRSLLAYNLGNGQGFSVRQVVDAAERVTGRKLRTSVAARRPGDPGVLRADASKITGELGWHPAYPNLDDMIKHAWEWIRSHPAGYATRRDERGRATGDRM